MRKGVASAEDGVVYDYVRLPNLFPYQTKRRAVHLLSFIEHLFVAKASTQMNETERILRCLHCAGSWRQPVIGIDELMVSRDNRAGIV